MQTMVQNRNVDEALLGYLKRRFRLFVHVSCLIPLGVLVWEFFAMRLTVNPIQAAEQRTGDIALVILLLSLVCSPVSSILGIKEALKYRRTLGLYAFFYAALHFSIFAGLDYTFRFDLIWDSLIEKPFILVGFAAGLIILALAVTSFQWWMRLLGKNWKRLQRLVYVSGILVIVHYLWAVKADIRLPALAGGVLLLLLILRIPLVKRALAKIRYELMSRKGS
jgi:sulfoxide reductase heme-binding subunit YedZ